MKEIFYAKVKDGQAKITNRKTFDDVIKSFEGKEIQITIQKKKKGRSMEQNRWWWACMTILSQHTGFTKDEIHEICKLKFLKKQKVNEKTGEVFDYIGSTADLSTVEFGEVIEEVIRWSAEELDCVLPYPNEQTELIN